MILTHLVLLKFWTGASATGGAAVTLPPQRMVTGLGT